MACVRAALQAANQRSASGWSIAAFRGSGFRRHALQHPLDRNFAALAGELRGTTGTATTSSGTWRGDNSQRNAPTRRQRVVDLAAGGEHDEQNIGGLIRVEPRGRQRLYRLASQSIADALEVLILLAPALPVSSLGDDTVCRAGRPIMTLSMRIMIPSICQTAKGNCLQMSDFRRRDKARKYPISGSFWGNSG